MSNQFNPAVPAIPLGQEGCVLAMQQGCPVFAGGATTAFNSATPVGIPSSGSFGDNGALSGLTSAFPYIYPFIYLFFPADAIFVGSQPGFYYTVMSSDTAGTVFNNMLLDGAAPRALIQPVPFVSTGPGGYTQTTNPQNLIDFPLRGGSLRDTGSLQMYSLFSMSNSAGIKTSNLLFGGTSVQQFNLDTSSAFRNLLWVSNRGVPSQQIIWNAFEQQFGESGPVNALLTVNTLDVFNVTVTGRMSTSDDFIVLEAFIAQIVNNA